MSHEIYEGHFTERLCLTTSIVYDYTDLPTRLCSRSSSNWNTGFLWGSPFHLQQLLYKVSAGRSRLADKLTQLSQLDQHGLTYLMASYQAPNKSIDKIQGIAVITQQLEALLPISSSKYESTVCMRRHPLPLSQRGENMTPH